MEKPEKPKASKKKVWIYIVLFFAAVFTYRILTPQTLEQQAAEKKRFEADSLEKAKEANQEKLEKAFSVWDGSNPALEKLVKGGMNDPESYKHINTQVFDKQGYYFVRMEFSGKNKFGGTVRNTVAANIDYEGNVIKILEQY